MTTTVTSTVIEKLSFQLAGLVLVAVTFEFLLKCQHSHSAHKRAEETSTSIPGKRLLCTHHVAKN